MKVASLVQNLIRRMKNTSEMLNIQTRIAIIDEFTQQLFMSGYGKDQVKRIITAGLVGYENIKSTAEKKGEGIHKSAASGAVQRRRARLIGKSSWFRSKPKQSTRDTSKPKPSTKPRVNKKKLPVSVLFCRCRDARPP